MTTTKIKRYELTLKAKVMTVKEQKEGYGQKLQSPDLVAELAQKLIGDGGREKSLAFFLDSRLTVKGLIEIGSGGFNSAPLDRRVLFSAALLAGADSIILAHNHPTGIMTASKEDRDVTQRIKNGAKILGINLLDHIIVGPEKGKFVSVMN